MVDLAAFGYGLLNHLVHVYLDNIDWMSIFHKGMEKQTQLEITNKHTFRDNKFTELIT